jgi:hypothetical protein
MGDKLSIRIKKVSIFSFAWNSTLFGLFSGFIFGVLLCLFIRTILNLTTDLPPTMDAPGFIAILILSPIVFAILGFILGLVAGAIINLVFRMTKGLKMNIEEDNVEAVKPAEAQALPKVEYTSAITSS